MDLTLWLFETKTTVTEMAKQLDIHRGYLHQIIRGVHIPSKKIMNKISKLTKGRVSNIEELRDKRFKSPSEERQP